VKARAFGILGGTFDPIHVGHLALAHEARGYLGLDHVLFVPNADPPHKRSPEVTPAAHREAMVTLAIEAEPTFRLSRLELERPGPSYAVDTVAELAQRSRGEGRPEPWFILSAEVLDDLDSWREPLRILDLCRMAVAPRPGAEPLDQAWLTAHYPGREHRFALLPGPQLDVTATDIRERVRRDLPIDDLVPEPVARYIRGHGLYEARDGARLGSRSSGAAPASADTPSSEETPS
jgi:nicotinate-nucleotide adenylyltransferase